MTKNRNKGFSLVEVIIGVAVLTILLTPVVKQLAQTMKTNRLAKEQQYVNDAATSLMEYTQKTDFTSFAKVSTTEGDGISLTEEPQKAKTSCAIYIYRATDDGATVEELKECTSDVAGVSGISYTTKLYKMNDVDLGSRKTTYTRTVLLDDLANKISSYTFEDDDGNEHGLRVVYGITSIDSLSLDEDFELTSEGSIVKYDTTMAQKSDGSDGDEIKYVKAIVCELSDADNAVEDPNESQIGSMHDLVSTQMALVNGAVSDYDSTARDALHTEMLDVIKTNAPETYEQIQQNENMSLDSYLNGFTKSIYIKVDNNTSDSSNMYYQVSVNVAYDATFRIAGQDYTLDRMEYSVFSQKYRYDGSAPTVPAVYIEYQPFLIDDVGYASSEYIYIENYVDNATIYMYKPTKDYVYSSGQYYGYDSSKVYDSEEDELYDIYDAELAEKKEKKEKGEAVTGKVYTQTGYSTVPVNIYINRMLGENECGESTTGKLTNIYTNMDVTANAASAGKYGQFILNGSVDTSKYANFTVTQEAEGSGVSGESTLRLLTLDQDKTNSDRLYTATVIVAPKEDGVNTVTLTGAKGGN